MTYRNWKLFDNRRERISRRIRRVAIITTATAVVIIVHRH
jgi:hypothetical protein